jgi:general secretion pathway protein D
MKKLFIGLIASLLLFPASGFVSEGKTPPVPALSAGTNTNSTLYGKAMGLEAADGASWGYIAYNATTGQDDQVNFKDGLGPTKTIPSKKEEPVGKKTAPDIQDAEPTEQKEPAVEKKPALPPAIPPGTSFTPLEKATDKVGGKDIDADGGLMPPSAHPLRENSLTGFTPEQIKAFLSKQKEEDHIILNFDNAALRDVINTISSITGENFILTPGLDARITIYSAGKIPTREALSVFESVLEVNNMALVKSGRFYKIVPIATAKQKPIEVQKGNEAEAVLSKDRTITQIVQVEYVPAAEISTVLQPMLSQFGSIIPNPRNNLLIINDTASNIKRLLSILKEIDVDAFKNTRMGFFQPKFSDVNSLSQEILEILSSLNLTQHGVAVIPMERINSLIVFTSSPSLLKIIEGWLKKLDEQVTTDQNIFVYPVQNVKAENIAEVLKTIYETEDGVKPKPRTTRKAPAPTGKAPRRQTRLPVKSQGQTPSSRVEIVIFEPTNSLVILAPPGIYRDIKDTIKKLDIYPLEVLIEVIIAEVTLTDSDQFGIQWSALHSVHIEGDKDFTGLVQGRSGNAPSYTLPLTLGTGTTPASLTASGFSYLLFKPDRLIAMLHALASKGKVNILSSPRLLVRNQEEASIEVGEDIPTATSSTQTAITTTATLTQNIEYKTVGVKLKIKPTINDEKTIVLDIEQEVSDKLPNVTVGQEGFSYPAFSTRKTKTSIIVPDKQTIVIGGIIKEKKDKNYQGIPILSSIPILGNLFRYTVDTKTKTELIILLTPHVITNRTEADVLTMEFLEKLKEIKDYLKESKSQINVLSPGEINPTQTNEQ